MRKSSLILLMALIVAAGLVAGCTCPRSAKCPATKVEKPAASDAASAKTAPMKPAAKAGESCKADKAPAPAAKAEKKVEPRASIF